MKQSFLAALALALVACASAPESSSRTSASAQPERAYRTGSNIPLK